MNSYYEEAIKYHTVSDSKVYPTRSRQMYYLLFCLKLYLLYLLHKKIVPFFCFFFFPWTINAFQICLYLQSIQFVLGINLFYNTEN